MKQRKFVRGTFIIEKNVVDLNAYYLKHQRAIDSIVKWADQVGMYVGFGTSSDNTYLCEYEVTQLKKSACTGLANELKAMLKAEWKSAVQLGFQSYGDRF